MATREMLAPNPHRSMGIDHVIVVGKSADQQRLVVLSVGALVKNPALTQTYGSGYKWATVFWNVVGAIMGDVPRNVEKGGAALLALSLLGSGC